MNDCPDDVGKTEYRTKGKYDKPIEGYFRIVETQAGRGGHDICP
jgi:hypothetical protein